MEKNISILLLIVIVLLITPYSFAETNFSAEHGVVQINEEFLEVDIVYPYFNGFTGSDKVNLKIKDLILSYIEDAKSTSKLLKETSDKIIAAGDEAFIPRATLEINYDYEKNGDLLSMQFNIDSYSGGAHPINWINSMTIDTKTGESLRFRDLFKVHDESSKMISNKIIKEIHKDKNKYFEDSAQLVMDKNNDFQFYIDGNSLVVYFDSYELAPYASGMTKFRFEAEELKDILKDKIYDSIKDGIKRGIINYNGVDIQSKNGILDVEVTMLPLRDIVEVLGYEVGWNKENGAIIQGGYIKEGINSYWVKGKEPISLISPVVIKGVTYVPLQYFTEVLEENVSLGTIADDKIIVRVYDKTGKDIELVD